MATANSLHTGHLIDAAFLTRPRATPRPELRLASGHEQAMAHRLHQLQTALGDEHPGIPGNTLPRAAKTPPPATHLFGTVSVLLASLASAALGASAMWFAMTANPSYAELPPAPMAASAVQQRAEPLVAASVTDERQIEDLLESWLQAWNERDIEAYLAAYGKQFTPADGSSHGNWVAARTKKLATASAIDVQIRDVSMTRQAPDLFKVSFRQDYASAGYREAGRAKSLLVARTDGHWKIVREQQE